VTTRPQIVTKNIKVLWLVTWQSAYKRGRFSAFRQFTFLWTEDSFTGLPCLELVILWSKTSSATDDLLARRGEMVVKLWDHESTRHTCGNWAHGQEAQTKSLSKTYSFFWSTLVACLGKMLTPDSANLACPNWPLATRLIWSKGRCLAQSS